MPIRTVADWSAAQDRAKVAFARIPRRVLVCSTGCRAVEAGEVADALWYEVAQAGLDQEVKVVSTGCHGLCAMAPVVLIEPEEILYGKVGVDDVKEIVEQTLKQERIIDRLCYQGNHELARLPAIPFYKHQRKHVLRRCGRIDPRSIDEAIARGGYAYAVKALTSMTAEGILDFVTRSGLRGRGGAGFPTGAKWRVCREAPGDEKYLICNADEGDPGAFMDRALLEGDPHGVIEGMIIAAKAIGATRGIVYVRAEYPIAVEHVGWAVEDARKYGLLGSDILGTGLDFDIEIRQGAGAFVCGEETALIASLEGFRGMPRPRPPFPAVSGYHGKPTNINNVETFANVPLVIGMGPALYGDLGTERSKGTKIFALAGDVRNTGLVEVPMGATLREIVYKVGGGIRGNREFKAAQTGGPSGGCVPAAHLDTPIDYDSLRELGAIMGSGGLIVMDDETCMVDMARYFLTFVQKECCGGCPPCRVGTKKMLEILERICVGQGREGDAEELERIAKAVQRASLCGLGQTAPNPVLSSLRHFREEYEAHIRDKRCPANVCEALINYQIDVDVCDGCGACVKACPSGAIEGKKKQPHRIFAERCTRCGACLAVCPTKAVFKESPGLAAHELAV
ncbi:MAG: NADH-quinone oxidoreductase subunit NuoF [Phycisphaerae bacterium]|nr:NADH-quinone oxidoreductase subunit NuoF [Phycisphaerae bacterium]